MRFSRFFYSRLVFAFLALTHCPLQSNTVQAEELPCYVCNEGECVLNPDIADCLQGQAQAELPEGFVPPAPAPNCQSESEAFEALQTPDPAPKPAESPEADDTVTPPVDPPKPEEKPECVVVLFTATWCPACIALKPILTPVIDELGKEFVVRLHLIDVSEGEDELSKSDKVFFNAYIPATDRAIPRTVGIKYEGGKGAVWWNEKGKDPAKYPTKFSAAIKANCPKIAK